MTEQGACVIWLLHAHEFMLPHECMNNTPTHHTCTLTHTTPQINKPMTEAATMTSLGIEDPGCLDLRLLLGFGNSAKIPHRKKCN